MLIEFVADLFPSASLLPSDPVLRAKARFFYDAVGTKYNPAYFSYVIRGDGSQEGLFKGIEELQALLPEKGYAVGDWSIADAAWTPFIARLLAALELDVGAYAVGEGPETLKTLLSDARFARFQQYWKDVSSRPSFTSTFDKVRHHACLVVLTCTDRLGFRNTSRARLRSVSLISSVRRNDSQ